MNSITAIVAAYNEEETIASVIETVKSSDLIDYIIVISDGSTDDTANIASKYDIRVLEIDTNKGKGAAVMKGLEYCRASDIVILLDADLIGLNKEHIEDLLLPIIEDRADMTIGIFSGGRMSTDLAQRLTPFLSGQRAIKKDLLDKVRNKDINQYGLEASITKYVKNEKIRVKEVKLRKLTHRTKEEKLGMLKGFKLRMKMYLDVAKALIKR